MRLETYPAEELGDALATRVAADLVAAIDTRDAARLAVPGGRTPAPFLRALGRIDLPWNRVMVTLTDERQVPVDHPRSNQRVLSETLFADRAAAARFVPLHGDVASVERALADALPLDVSVLGMGDDMHTASLFPGSPELAAALDSNGAACAMAVTAPGQPEARVTLTAPVFAAARCLYLLIQGADKRAALDRAMAATDPLTAPVKVVLDAAQAPIVFYAE